MKASEVPDDGCYRPGAACQAGRLNACFGLVSDTRPVVANVDLYGGRSSTASAAGPMAQGQACRRRLLAHGPERGDPYTQ